MQQVEPKENCNKCEICEVLKKQLAHAKEMSNINLEFAQEDSAKAHTLLCRNIELRGKIEELELENEKLKSQINRTNK